MTNQELLEEWELEWIELEDELLELSQRYYVKEILLSNKYDSKMRSDREMKPRGKTRSTQSSVVRHKKYSADHLTDDI